MITIVLFYPLLTLFSPNSACFSASHIQFRERTERPSEAVDPVVPSVVPRSHAVQRPEPAAGAAACYPAEVRSIPQRFALSSRSTAVLAIAQTTEGSTTHMEMTKKRLNDGWTDGWMDAVHRNEDKSN